MLRGRYDYEKESRPRQFDLKLFIHVHGFRANPEDNLKWAKGDMFIQLYPKANERTLMKIVFNKKHIIYSGLKPRSQEEASVLFTLLKII